MENTKTDINNVSDKFNGDLLWLITESLIKKSTLTELTVHSKNIFLGTDFEQILTSIFKIDKTIPNKKQQIAT